MIAGLLFAIGETDDRPERLTATLPFGGVTLIEYQARLLVEAGASQIIILVARLTPELLGAVSRIGRRGVTVDAVRHASEAAAKLHPLARVLMLADGLITTERVVATLAEEGGDALLVVAQADAGQVFERLGGGQAWAGVARLDPQRIGEVARLPRDYDPQSTLVRVAEQARAVHVLLPPDALAHGHGIERNGAALATRGRAVLAAIVSDRRGWYDRWLLAPLARLALPAMIARQWPGALVGGAGAALGALGLAGLAFGWSIAGLVLACVACLVLGLGATLSGLRDEPGTERGQRVAGLAIPALASLFLGAAESGRSGNLAALAVAAALVTLAALAERAGPERLRAWWWGSAPAYLLGILAATSVGWPVIGMAAAAAYATATLGAAIERLRQP
ncbi:MAG: hypothetical protein JWN21_763 [Sphingomonas bacterium]|uniref:hypothetical protein n=1 Tax=Sphingomonas bacterium TaxID=1895847 RepID=UPI002626AA98|nr:hypothetical protein [Sphingomonas bacterium]MDB5695220.1 hypothetical protein [Sphingomonas bacterium]